MTDLSQIPTEQLVSMLGSIKQSPKLKDDTLSTIGAGALSFGQGGMPIFDEAGAAAGAGLEKLGLLDKLGNTFGESYDKRLENIRNTEQAFGKEHPIADTALRIGGAVTATLPAAKALAASPIIGSGLYGAAQGFTGATGGIGNRSISGVAGGALGAGAGAIGKYVVSPLIAKVTGGSGGATKAINQSLEDSGVDPADFARNLQQSTPDEFAGELGGEQLRMLTQNRAKITGPGMQEARTAMRERLSESPQRVSEIIQKNFKPQPAVDQMIDNIDNMASQADQLYAAAKPVPVDGRTFNALIDRPASQEAMATLVNNLKNAGKSLDASGIIQKADGSYIFAKDVSTDIVNEFEKNLGTLVKRNEFGQIITDDPSNKIIEGLRKDVISALRQKNPVFDKAAMVSHAKLAATDAFDLGRDYARMGAGDKADTLSNLALDKFSPNERSYFSAGFQTGLTDATRGAQLGTGNNAARIGNQNVIYKAENIIGPQGAQNFAGDLAKEKLKMELANRAINNSTTPDLLGGGIPLSKSGMMSKIANAVSDKLDKNTSKKLSEMLYSQSPSAKQKLAELLMRSQIPYYARIPDQGIAYEGARMLSATSPAMVPQSFGAIINQPRGR